MLEIELKARVNSLDPVRRELIKRGATSRGRQHEHDIYYNAPHRDFGKTDEALRVRYTNDHAVVTYKGAKLKQYGLKAREELNFAVESGELFEQMLDRLGFCKTAEVNKWRENFQLNDAAVSLDMVDELGTFVEIEIMTEADNASATDQIQKIAKEIGVSGEPILASYLELLLSKRSEVQP
jgi:adenylate cyclase, class 2